MIWDIAKRYKELENNYLADNSVYELEEDVYNELNGIKEAISDYLGADFEIVAKLEGNPFWGGTDAVKTYKLVKRPNTNKKK